ncbi:hypothetical protein EDD11_002943 [Mortierella claussenii]|nr:hypothetical protein EDD11_002943 [Mortierella claussenii]
MKVDLKSSYRSSTLISPKQLQQPAMSGMNHSYHSLAIPHPSYPGSLQVDDRLDAHLSPPTLHGVRCTEVSQKAYTGQSSQMKKSFDRLQHMDSGKVEYRTIAFCTHLTVSRWEPSVPASTAASSSTPSEEPTNQPGSSPVAVKNDPAHAARLMSLANYIRHILSLTAGNPNAQPQVTTKQQSKQDQARMCDNPLSAGTSGSNAALSSGPGPIKSTDSSRRHRYSPNYHPHLARRQAHHQGQQPERRPSTNLYQPSEGSMTHSQSAEYPYDHGYREGSATSDHLPRSPTQQYGYQGVHQAALQFYPQQQRPHHAPLPRQPRQGHAWTSPHASAPIRSTQPLLKIPHPNLTLTLALIYVDRLKAKYPEAKGEPGCSHRLFLVAFIIAAKYRCSVELSPALEMAGSENRRHSRLLDNNNNSDEMLMDGPLSAESDSMEQMLEARLNAELIFSNHAWVRLLNLGSFYRQPASEISSASAAASPASSSLMSSNMAQPSGAQNRSTTDSPSSLSSVASPRLARSPDSATPPLLPSISSLTHTHAPLPTAAAMLQVEDLDRMEAEFLTFLNFDLATLSHDLETCWNLLVGKKESEV